MAPKSAQLTSSTIYRHQLLSYDWKGGPLLACGMKITMPAP